MVYTFLGVWGGRAGGLFATCCIHLADVVTDEKLSSDYIGFIIICIGSFLARSLIY